MNLTWLLRRFLSPENELFYFPCPLTPFLHTARYFILHYQFMYEHEAEVAR